MSKKKHEPQDRASNIRLPEGVSPDQALSAVLRIKPEDAKRIREGEQKMKGGKKGKG